MKDITLTGGTNDGRHVDVFTGQPLVYVTKKHSPEEIDALKIDETMGWKASEEVYMRNNDGGYVYDRTVHYNPDLI